MSKNLLFWGIIILIIGPTLQTNYCALCENKSHTMCKYKKGPSDNCTGYSSNKMTPEIQNLIVGLHNKIRNKVASGREIGKKFRTLPPGEDIHALKWDQELATISQRWADQCVSVSEKKQHDDCKITDRFAVGQNVIQAIRSRSVIDFTKFVVGAVKQWYNEVDKVDPLNIARFRSSTTWNTHIGNFAQLVWAQTKYIGCAHTSFAINSTIDGFGVLDRLVCNYGPSGNVVGNPVYKAGFPCSKCRCGSKKYPALCDGNFLRKKRQSIKAEPGLNNSNIYKTDEAEFKLNHHLTQKLFQLFEKLNLTINNNLLMQLNDIHNKYNLSKEVQDISKHAEEPDDVAYFDELEFQTNFNDTFEWKAVGRTNQNKTVPVRQRKRKKFRSTTLVTSTTPTSKTTTMENFHEQSTTPPVCPYRAVPNKCQGDKCFCYYKYFIS